MFWFSLVPRQIAQKSLRTCNLSDMVRADHRLMDKDELTRTGSVLDGGSALDGGATPLPRLWERAQRWSTQKGAPRLDVRGLKRMIEAEKTGRQG